MTNEHRRLYRFSRIDFYQKRRDQKLFEVTQREAGESESSEHLRVVVHVVSVFDDQFKGVQLVLTLQGRAYVCPFNEELSAEAINNQHVDSAYEITFDKFLTWAEKELSIPHG